MKKDKHDYLAALPKAKGPSPKTQYKELLEQQKALDRKIKALEEQRQQAIKDIAANQIKISYKKEYLGITDEEVEAAIHHILSNPKDVHALVNASSLETGIDNDMLEELKLDSDTKAPIASRNDELSEDEKEDAKALSAPPAPSQPISKQATKDLPEEEDNTTSSHEKSEPAPSQPISYGEQAAISEDFDSDLISSDEAIEDGINENDLAMEELATELDGINEDDFAMEELADSELAAELDNIDDPDPEDAPLPVDPYQVQKIESQKGNRLTPPPPPKRSSIKPAGEHNHGAFQSYDHAAALEGRLASDSESS